MNKRCANLLNWLADQPLTVELNVAAPQLGPEHALTLAGGPNRYSNGPLLIDGTQDPSQDLTFAPLYRGTALDPILPITHMAANRNGLLGWPPLYALLAWLVVWCAIVLLVSVIRERSGP